MRLSATLEQVRALVARGEVHVALHWYAELAADDTGHASSVENVEEIGSSLVSSRFHVEAPRFMAHATEGDESFPPSAAYRFR